MLSETSVLLVEPPAIALEWKGDILGEVLLRHPKYAQLLLAENLSRASVHCSILDLKSNKNGLTEQAHTRTIQYGDAVLTAWQIGVPLEVYESELLRSSIIGISANYTCERSAVVGIVEFAKRIGTRAVIVVGGHDATADPRYYLDKGADICVLGEGETILPEILHSSVDRDFGKIPGLAFLSSGALRVTGKRRSHDLSKVAFPSSKLMSQYPSDQVPDGPLPEGVIPSVAVLETSRGCNEACSFCDSTFIVGKYRSVALPILEERILSLKNAGVSTIVFADDNILYRMLPRYGGRSGRDDLLRFFSALFEAGMSWSFYNGIQFGLLETDGIIDIELIRTLFQNNRNGNRYQGCFRAYIPLEKFDSFEMSKLRKLKAIDVEKQIVSAIASAALAELNLGFIIGSIYETPRNIEETIKMAAEFQEIVRESSCFKTIPFLLPWCSVPLPGTPDFTTFKPHMMYMPGSMPELFGNYTSVIRNDHFMPWDLTQIRGQIDHELNGDRLVCDYARESGV